MQTDLLGRDGELALLQRCHDDALEGRARLVLCQGEPGIGKTRLAEEVVTGPAPGACPRCGAWLSTRPARRPTGRGGRPCAPSASSSTFPPSPPRSG
jgi:hypothetical protein